MANLYGMLQGIASDMRNPVQLSDGAKGLFTELGNSLAPMAPVNQEDPVSLRAAAAEALRRGDAQQARIYAVMASERDDAVRMKNASQNALLDEGNAEIQAEAARKRQGLNNRQAGAAYERFLSPDLLQAVKRGDMSPAEAVKAQQTMNAAAMKEQAANQRALFKASAPGAGGGLKFSTGSTIEDSEGNLFEVASVRDPSSGQTRTAYTPLSPSSPAQPVGEITIVNKSSGLMAGQQEELELKQEWRKERGTMISDFPNLLEQKSKVSQALSLAEKVPTGGLREQVNNISNYLGIDGNTADAAVLGNAMSQYVMDRIKMLGVNPTDTDLTYLRRSVQDFGKSQAANVALFKDSMERLNRVVTAREWLLDNPEASRDDYVKNYKGLVEGGSSAPVDFNSLPKK